MSSAFASGSKNLTSTPYLLNVTLNRLYVPPYTIEEEMMLSPALQAFRIANVSAAIPDEQASAATPSSSIAIFFSNASIVGFEILVYKCPVSG